MKEAPKQMVDKGDPKSVASWLVAKWMATCDIYEFNESHRRQNDYLRNLIVAELSELTKLKADVERLKAALKPFAECVGNEIRLTENNTNQVFYNFVPIGSCRNAARALEETK